MKFVTGYLWREGVHDTSQSLQQEAKDSRQHKGNLDNLLLHHEKHPDSLLLQQMKWGRNRSLLACVCSGGLSGAYFTGRLKDWLFKHREMCLSRVVDRAEILRSLQGEICGIRRDLYDARGRFQEGDIDFAGILIVDQDFWLLQGGACGSYYLNRRFSNTHCKRLGAEYCENWQVLPGKLEKGVGILMGCGGFLEGLSVDVIKQCMAAQDIYKEEQIANRLAELYGEIRRQGYEAPCSAVYLKSVF